MSDERPPFHLAFPVRDLDATRAFYVDVLGCKEGRSAERWVDLDFFGHQISAHLAEEGAESRPTNAVDGDDVPVRHFGVILGWEAFDELADRLRAAGIRFRIPPRVRFAGQPGEQKTMFFDDPASNALEVKAFRDPADVFQR